MIGQTISHYRILEKLGQGGMGVVYKAEDTRLKRTVALKFLPPELTRDKEAKKRFLHEARAASALDYPNICSIYEIDETEDGRMFMAMAYYEGQTLRDKIASGPLPLAQALDIAIQIAEGLNKAHKKGIIHRDIKSANIMVTDDGVVKILDFGLAKLKGATKLTREGTTLGTVAYMSPEQAAGDNVDQRTDIWSLGVVLYEMITGQLPFKGEYEQAIIYAILNDNPILLSKLNPVIEKKLEGIVFQALDKNRDLRYKSCGELIKALKNAQNPQPYQEASGRYRFFKKPAFIIFGMGLILALGFWVIRSIGISKKIQWAHEEGLPGITRFMANGDYNSAFRLAKEVEPYVPHNPQWEQLQLEFSQLITIHTKPDGAEVYFQNYDDWTSDWQKLGISPIDNIRIPRSYLRWKIEKAGYETIIASSDGSQTGLMSKTGDITLFKKGTYPADMVFIPGQEHKLHMWGLEHLVVKLDDYLIDKYEVTNKEFKKFIDSGGYRKRAFWKYPFKKGEKVLSWEKAMEVFTDKTGYPGPSTWEISDYPDGQDDYPVCGVSWYEAMAYAEFVGKSLPSVYHWDMMASINESSHIIPLSNINQKTPARVGAYKAIGNFETYDIAGNAREWCYNQRDQERFILGGGWDDQDWGFYDPYSQPPFDRSITNGFRCMIYLNIPQNLTKVQAPIDRPRRDFRTEKPVSDQIYTIYRSMYDYDQKPLNARVISRNKDIMNERLIVKVSFDAAYADEKVMAYLFLPLKSKPPFQTVIFFPGGTSIIKRSSEDLDISLVEFLIKSGRALMVPIYKCTYERGDGFLNDQPDMTIEYKDHLIMWVKDFRRSIDYLETRKDIDKNNLAYFGHSWGARMGGIILAIEPRIKTGILHVGGLKFQRCYPEVDPFNFVSRITIPVLMLNGKYDSWFPLETSQRPMFNLLGTAPEHKNHIVFETGHSVPREILIREGLAWLDRYLGPVKQ